ncbi:acetolactate synthase 2 catalytic subunit [Paraferrimonas sp. SM1919]|uniref:acetolactate synthase 2 catalytic subunit n=1 Tax=Paraferrimonas sp. SM1919 TaxID=2662263 RepID=UPI001969CFBB|nr:acetolactate synthase 2 catalytic subunit [Paraferrimonas sp. SM1919]
MISGAQAVVQTIHRHGVNCVFGYPGGAIMPVYDALYESPVKHVLCRHEQGAGFAALGFARASGKVGVCIATSGPGATNLITALADAMMDSVPMVAVTGQVPQVMIGTDGFQEIDVLGLSLACTKHSFLVRSIDELIPTLYEAFELAQSGRPGPVLVDIPKNLQQQMFEPQWLTIECMPPSIPTLGCEQQAMALMQASQKPICYVGGGVSLADAVTELRQFLATTGMPAVTTLKGIGSCDPDSPHFLGMLGMHGLKAANLAVQECDLLVVIGARFDDRVTGKLDEFAVNAKVIHIDIDPSEMNKVRPADVSILGDLKYILPAMGCALDIAPWKQQTTGMKALSKWDYNAPIEGIYAPKMLNQLADALPANSVVTCDVGQHQMWVAQHMYFNSPKDHLSSSGLGTMGFGLPAAIGAQVARPHDTVVVVSGDGSFMMNVQELTTIKRLQIPVKILLIDNQKLGMVKQWQQLFFDGRYSETDLSDNPDFVAMAAAFDIKGMHINRPDQVADGIANLINSKGPFILHVSINETENVWPLVPPGANNSQMMEQVS